MPQLQHIVKLLPCPRAEVEGVTRVVGSYQAVQLCGATADHVQRLHEGGDMTPPVPGHDGHVGPEEGLAAHLLVVQHNDSVLILVISTQPAGHQSDQLVNFAAVPGEILVIRGLLSQSVTLVQSHTWGRLHSETDHKMRIAGTPPPRTT